MGDGDRDRHHQCVGPAGGDQALIPDEGRRRVAIENVSPEIDGGRFAVKRVVGDVLTAEADAFTDGHDEIRVVLGWCEDDCLEWREVEMEHLGNDRWRASFPLAEIGRYQYTVTAWVDHWETWRHDLKKRVDAGQDVTVDLQIGSCPELTPLHPPAPRR